MCAFLVLWCDDSSALTLVNICGPCGRSEFPWGIWLEETCLPGTQSCGGCSRQDQNRDVRTESSVMFYTLCDAAGNLECDWLCFASLLFFFLQSNTEGKRRGYEEIQKEMCICFCWTQKCSLPPSNSNYMTIEKSVCDKNTLYLLC